MSVGLDTSVTLRLLTGVPELQARAAQAFVATASETVTISDLVVSETYFALLHHYAVPHSDAVRALSALLTDARIRGTGIAVNVLGTLAASRATSAPRPGVMNRLIHGEYARDGITLVTFDRDLARLPDVHQLR